MLNNSADKLIQKISTMSKEMGEKLEELVVTAKLLGYELLYFDEKSELIIRLRSTYISIYFPRACRREFVSYIRGEEIINNIHQYYRIDVKSKYSMKIVKKTYSEITETLQGFIQSI